MELETFKKESWTTDEGFTKRFAARAASIGASIDRLPILFYWIVFLLVLLSSVLASQGGLVHPEAEQYIPHYLSQAPFWHKIYDYQKVEVGIPPDFRPRPLSYIIDYLDVQFIAWSARQGHPHFLSASNFVFWIAGAILMWFCFRSLFGIDRLNSGLLICLVSTAPGFFLLTFYFRSAKSASIFFLLCAFLSSWACFRSVQEGRHLVRMTVLSLLTYLLLVAGCLCDEIPAAFTFVALIMLGREAWLTRDNRRLHRAILTCLLPIALAISTFIIYDIYGHARLVKIFTGETDLAIYQASLLASLFRGTIIHLIGTASVFTEVFGFLAGGISSILATCLLVFLCWYWKRASGWSAAVRIVLVGFLMFGVLFVMISRHTPIMSFSVRRGYYTTPLMVVFLFFLAISIGSMSKRGFFSRDRIRGMLFILVLSNMTCLAREWKFPADAKDPGKEYARAMIAALKSSQGITPAMFKDSNLGVYFERVAKSPVYKVLSHGVTEPRR